MECDVVLDVGKTHSKLTLWDRGGSRLAQRVHRNASVKTRDYASLDVAGIEQWLVNSLRELTTLGTIRHIIPVGHGAAAALLHEGRMAYPPMDYEQALPTDVYARYLSLRDPFASTGSPALPSALNLGAQLFWMEELHPRLLEDDAQIVPWAQYWAWLLCGVPASEISSLGCHTDLWLPFVHSPSRLAANRGWAQKLAPLHRASEILGTVRAEWAHRCGLPADTQVLCGLHDSNAALLAAREFPEIGDHDATVVSTGTWFVAMRSNAGDFSIDQLGRGEQRDCLVNVDIFGQPVPSARFMGGREVELLRQAEDCPIDALEEQAALLDAALALVRSGGYVLPTHVPGVGPYPAGPGSIVAPTGPHERGAAIALCLALLTDAALDLIGSRGRLMIEGRFGAAEVFTRALATLRPQISVFVSIEHDGIPHGARELVRPSKIALEPLRRIQPLPLDMRAYRDRWRAAAHDKDVAA